MRLSRHTKQVIARVGFSIEVVAFAWVYFLGPQGLRIMWQMRRENGQMQRGIEKLRTEVGELEQEIAQWRYNAFYKEKFAREQLQMARAGDVVYIRE